MPGIAVPARRVCALHRDFTAPDSEGIICVNDFASRLSMAGQDGSPATKRWADHDGDSVVSSSLATALRTVRWLLELIAKRRRKAILILKIHAFLILPASAVRI